MVLSEANALLIEVKGVWLRDSIAYLDVRPEDYVEALRKQYGITDSPEPGQRRIKGVGQLARTIRALGDGTCSPSDLGIDATTRLIPVMVVHDVHVGAPLHSHFLAQELAHYLDRQADAAAWTPMQFGRYEVAHLVLLTLRDLEVLETSVKNFSLSECIEKYVAECPDRVMSFHNWLLGSPFAEGLRHNEWLTSEALKLLHKAKARLFPKAE